MTVARHAAARHPGYAVHGELWSAINGRPLQRFAAPGTDLATAELPAWRRPAWVLPLLSEYGARAWRLRMRWLRRRLGGLDVAFFADARGGSFEETFPAVGRFPARALLVPLDGRIRAHTPHGVRELEPPAAGRVEVREDEALERDDVRDLEQRLLVDVVHEEVVLALLVGGPRLERCQHS